MIKLYKLDGCICCEILEQKLKEKMVPFESTLDWSEINCHAFSSAPVLDVNGELMSYSRAIQWVAKYQKNWGN